MTADIVALADREDIRELLHRYCFALDRGSVDEALTRKRIDLLLHHVHNQDWTQRLNN